MLTNRFQHELALEALKQGIDAHNEAINDYDKQVQELHVCVNESLSEMTKILQKELNSGNLDEDLSSMVDLPRRCGLVNKVGYTKLPPRIVAALQLKSYTHPWIHYVDKENGIVEIMNSGTFEKLYLDELDKLEFVKTNEPESGNK